MQHLMEIYWVRLQRWGALSVFIRIITNEDLPTFERIKICLSHTFAGGSHKLLLVYPFPIPQLDAKTNIWWVSFDPNQQEEPDKAVILPVTSVSPPIVVAWEDGKLWFWMFE